MGNPCDTEEVAATTALTSEELIALSNEQIALRLYFVIANGTGKGLTDIAEISNMLYGFAEQLIRKQK